MKTGLKISLLTNIGLVALTGWLAWYPRQTGSARESSPHPVPTVAPSEPAPIPEAKPFRWSRLESSDYRVYVANLRRVGCPEQTIRDIIAADVDALYSQKRTESRLPEAGAGHWSRQEEAWLIGLLVARPSGQESSPLPTGMPGSASNGAGGTASAMTTAGSRAMTSAYPMPITAANMATMAIPPATMVVGQGSTAIGPITTASKPATIAGNTAAETANTAASMANPVVPPVAGSAKPAELPLVLQNADTSALGLTDDQKTEIEQLRQQFLDQTGGPNADPRDRTYLETWESAQQQADNLLDAMIGRQAFLQYEEAVQSQSSVVNAGPAGN